MKESGIGDQSKFDTNAEAVSATPTVFATVRTVLVLDTTGNVPLLTEFVTNPVIIALDPAGNADVSNDPVYAVVPAAAFAAAVIRYGPNMIGLFWYIRFTV